LSHSMRRRLAIARALLNQPDLIFMDEPTIDLDQKERLSIWNFMNQIRSENRTLVFSTPFAEEAEKMADRIAIVDHGKILTTGEPAELIREHVGFQLAEIQFERQDLQYYINRLSEQHFEFQTYRNFLKIHIRRKDDLPRILELFKDLHFNIRRANLGDVFLKLAGRDLREDPL
jgi:lipooligosaccharide transport system ATP-binding protein